MNLLKDRLQDIKETEERKDLIIANYKENYVAYDIPLKFLYYNDQNDRIATWISEYKSENNIKTINKDNIEKYNDIIQGFIENSDKDSLNETKNNISLMGQRVPGVVLSDGRVIDGNRRFTCLRKIEAETSKAGYFRAFIIDKNFEENEKIIKSLELSLQHGVDKPVDYNPIEKLVGVYNDIIENKIFSIKEYADAVNMKEKEIIKEVERAELMVDFLEYMNSPKKFYLARKMNINDPLKELQKILRKVEDEDKKNNIKNIIFAHIAMKPFGDMTRYIRKVTDILADNKNSDRYIEEQIEFSEEVYDIIADQDYIDSSVVNDIIRSENKEIQRKLENSTEKWKAKADSDSIKNLPSKQLDKIFDIIDRIDTNVFLKLSDEKLEEIRIKIDSVQRMLGSIKDDLNNV